MYHPNTVFNQMLKYFKCGEFEKLIKKYQLGHRVHNLSR